MIPPPPPPTTTTTMHDDGHLPLGRRFVVPLLFRSTWFESSWWLFSTTMDTLWMYGLVVIEIIVSYLIVQHIVYTEIDFKAYMEQCTLVVYQHIRDYYEIRGNTGPLVYPAGFVYLYSGIQAMTGYTTTTTVSNSIDDDDTTNNTNTNNEHAIRQTQYLFVFLYAMTQYLVFYIYYHSTTRMIQQQQLQQQQQRRKDLTDTHQTIASESSTTSSSFSDAAYQIWKFRAVLLLLCLSKRMHSIYVLRLFNDGITMMFFYASMVCFLSSSSSNMNHNNNNNNKESPTQQQQQQLYHQYQRRMNIGCIVFSLAVSIKMNVLLFAPGLLLLVLHISDNFYHCIYRIVLYCGVPQFVLGLPFLLKHPVHYIHKAFELDRSFFYIWTVNWKFLPEDIFVSKPLSIVLLLCHIGTLMFFAHQWIQSISGGNSKNPNQPKRPIFFIHSYHPTTTNTNETQAHSLLCMKKRLSPIYMTSTMFTANFIGIVFARTLHYQFYSWYYHAIPFLLFCNDIYNHTNNNNKNGAAAASQKEQAQRNLYWSYPILIRIAIIVCIELAFLTFPATPYSSFLLQISHLLILLQIRPPPYHLFLCNDEMDMEEVDTTQQIKKMN